MIFLVNLSHNHFKLKLNPVAMIKNAANIALMFVRFMKKNYQAEKKNYLMWLIQFDFFLLLLELISSIK